MKTRKHWTRKELREIELLNLRQAAAYLRTTSTTMHDWIYKAQDRRVPPIRYSKIGGQLRFHVADLDQLIEDRKVVAGQKHGPLQDMTKLKAGYQKWLARKRAQDQPRAERGNGTRRGSR